MSEVWTVANYEAEFGPFASYEDAKEWADEMGHGRPSLLWHPVIYREDSK